MTLSRVRYNILSNISLHRFVIHVNELFTTIDIGKRQRYVHFSQLKFYRGSAARYLRGSIHGRFRDVVESPMLWLSFSRAQPGSAEEGPARDRLGHRARETAVLERPSEVSLFL